MDLTEATPANEGIGADVFRSWFPSDYRPGDALREVCPPPDWKPQFTVPAEGGAAPSATTCRGNPLKYVGITYRQFTTEDDRDKLFAAIGRQDEDYVRSALELRDGENGLYINLNILPDHPGWLGNPEKGLPGKPPLKDRRKWRIRDSGAALLARCLPTFGLRSLILQLSRNDISSVGMKILVDSFSADLVDLKLFLAANNIRSAGCIALAQGLEKLKHLSCLHLNLGGNAITDQGNSMLAECLPSGLRQFRLHMRWNSLSDELLPGRERMYLAGETLPHIDRSKAESWWIMY